MPDRPSLTDRLARLVEGAKELTSEHRLEAVLQGIADLAREVVEARYAAVGLLNPDRRTLEVFVTSGLSPEQVERIGPPPTGRGVLGTVIREARPLRLANLTDHPDSVGFPEGHPPMTTFLGVPLAGRTAVLGNLYLTEKLGGEFSHEDEYLARLVAGMAASAVENARAHETSARLLAEVQGLLRTRERFFAMVNHELRNALAAVYGWAELLTRRKTRSDLPSAAFEILESAESAVALINDLLDLSRIDEDRLRPVPRDLDLVPAIAAALDRMTPTARARRVTLLLEAPPDGLLCRTDSHRVEQILVNLISNAIRHTGEGSRVLVRATGEPHGITVTVLDEGEGVPPEHMENLFDVYHSWAGAQGVGLGLPLSQRLARLLGGELRARNREPPARGASFSLHLPWRVPEPEGV
jgi:signal transduction histidine kinase